MIFGLEWAAAIACVLVMYVGSTVQSAIGIGMGMITAPLLALVDSDFIPATIVILVFPLTVSVAWADRRHVESVGVGIALLGRLPGAAAGAVVAAAVSDDVLALFVAVSVIAAVVVSLGSRRFQPTNGRLAVAGLASGFAGTTTGVGGPPMALTYQHADPLVMRSSLSAFFAVGSVMSIVALSATGQIGTRQWQLAALLLPGVVLGVATARVVARRLPTDLVRNVVLVICTMSSVLLIGRVAT